MVAIFNDSHRAKRSTDNSSRQGRVSVWVRVSGWNGRNIHTHSHTMSVYVHGHTPLVCAHKRKQTTTSLFCQYFCLDRFSLVTIYTKYGNNWYKIGYFLNYTINLYAILFLIIMINKSVHTNRSAVVNIAINNVR